VPLPSLRSLYDLALPDPLLAMIRPHADSRCLFHVVDYASSLSKPIVTVLPHPRGLRWSATGHQSTLQARTEEGCVSDQESGPAEVDLGSKYRKVLVGGGLDRAGAPKSLAVVRPVDVKDTNIAPSWI